MKNYQQIIKLGKLLSGPKPNLFPAQGIRTISEINLKHKQDIRRKLSERIGPGY